MQKLVLGAIDFDCRRKNWQPKRRPQRPPKAEDMLGRPDKEKSKNGVFQGTNRTFPVDGSSGGKKFERSFTGDA
jgi:hypothetical protein